MRRIRISVRSNAGDGEVSKARRKIGRTLTALVGGPYRAPVIPENGFLRCRLRGRLKVAGYSDGRMAWPIAAGHHKRQLIVCGDLVKALRTESRLAIRHHWGISLALISEYRRALGIERYTPGSWRLFWRNVNLARTPEARAKMSRQREGRKDLMSRADRERLRAIQRRPKPEAWKWMMSERMRRRCALLGPFERWLPEEEAMFGIVPDREIAKITGRSLSAVKGKKFALRKQRSN